MAKRKPEDRAVCRNRKATHRFLLLEKMECGLALRGGEVKSLRQGRASLEEAYACFEGGELWLIGFHISPYENDQTLGLNPTRRRKLLARAQELRKLKPKVEQKGLTMVPLRVYFNDRGFAKLELALAKGKSRGDKRESMKKKEHQREMQRATYRRG